MAVKEWVRIALGWREAPRPAPLPVQPRLVLIAPYMRDAQLWCHDNGMHPREAYIVTSSDRLRGLAGPLELVWVNWHRWPSLGEYDRICNYADMLASRGYVVRETEAYT